jgi:hypothetical protein
MHHIIVTWPEHLATGQQAARFHGELRALLQALAPLLEDRLNGAPGL